MINFNDIGAWHFVSELDILEADSHEDVTVTIADASGAAVLNGTYIPVDGKVRVYHLYKLLSPLIAEVAATFRITVGEESKTVHVVQSRLTVNEPAMKFLPSFFLSTVMSERDTSEKRKELLTLLPIETSLPAVIVVATYWNGSEVVTVQRTLDIELQAGEAAEVDVSAAQFVDLSMGRLVGYTVKAGERTMRYRVSTLPTAETAMLMRNAFGAWEAVYFAGMQESDPDYVRETALVNGQLRMYNLEETDTVKSWTGALRPSGVALVRDLARSREVLLLDKGVAIDAVVVTGVDVKHNTADDTVADMTVTWRRAEQLSARLMTVRAPKLFDSTFDETYN